MKAVILAAGISSRLRPLTNHTPKCLLTIADKTILEITIDNLLANRINDIIIVTGYLEEKIKAFIKKQYPQLQVCYISNNIYQSTNNIYSLWLVKEPVINHDILLLDSDIVFDKKIIHLLLTSGHKNCLAVKSDLELGTEEIKISLVKEGYISEISKEVNLNRAAGESIGIELFEKDKVNALFNILDRMINEEKQVNIWYESAFQKLIDQGTRIYPVNVGKLGCAEIDTLEDIEYARNKVIPLLNR